MKTQSLNGTWRYRVGGGRETEKEVPFCTLPVGRSICTKRFDLRDASERVLLRFDGITYHATVTLNGCELGEMLPYCEYTFDITDRVKEKDNLLTVTLEDIAPVFGPSEGWENFGGIIRDVTLLYAPNVYIEDVFFHATLKNGYRDADCTVEIKTNLPTDARIAVTVADAHGVLLSYTQAANETCVAHTATNVHLWSPDDPHLYTLTVCLFDGENVSDTYTCRVGLRELCCSRHRFLLNGKDLFFKGICKHEMFGDDGHCVTEEQMRLDLEMIRDLGCNFVRLVHYPHNKKILDLADEMGLMVSEEPGLWWSETADPEISRGSLEVLRRTILRDRNHPSIMFWLCFNECKFTEQFLIDSANLCRKTDPTRLVSGANCMSLEDTLKYYNLCNFDFYTMHPYADTFALAQESAAVLHDKPLLFTEWGGYHVYNNPHLLADFIKKIYKLYLANSDEGALAGAFLWCWAEVNDFNRGRPACIDGNLSEGLVDRHRRPLLNYQAFKNAWHEAEADVTRQPEDDYEFIKRDTLTGKTFLPLEGGADFAQFLQEMTHAEIAKFDNKRHRRIAIGPRLQKEEFEGMRQIPCILSDNTEILCRANGPATDTVTLIGAVSAPKGYPISGEYGECAAEIEIIGTRGERSVFPLRNGVDFANLFTVLGSSRIEPIAENATPFADFYYEKNFERYRINRLEIKLSEPITVKEIRLRSLRKGYSLLVYGIYL